MLAYMTAGEAAEKWSISHRRVITLCQENRIPDVAMLGNMWIIPKDAEKPVDGRTIRYDKKNPAKPFVKLSSLKKVSHSSETRNVPFKNTAFSCAHSPE